LYGHDRGKNLETLLYIRNLLKVWIPATDHNFMNIIPMI